MPAYTKHRHIFIRPTSDCIYVIQKVQLSLYRYDTRICVYLQARCIYASKMQTRHTCICAHIETKRYTWLFAITNLHLSLHASNTQKRVFMYKQYTICTPNTKTIPISVRLCANAMHTSVYITNDISNDLSPRARRTLYCVHAARHNILPRGQLVLLS